MHLKVKNFFKYYAFLFITTLCITFFPVAAEMSIQAIEGRVILADDGSLSVKYEYSLSEIPKDNIITINTPNILYQLNDVIVYINGNKIEKTNFSLLNNSKFGLPEGIRINIKDISLSENHQFTLTISISCSTFLEKGFESCEWGSDPDPKYDPCDDYFRLKHQTFEIDNVNTLDTQIDISLCAPYGVTEEKILYEIPEGLQSYSYPEYINIGAENYADDDKRYCLSWAGIEDEDEPTKFTLLVPEKSVLASYDDFADGRRQ